MDFIDKRIDAYAEKSSGLESALLSKLHRETYLKTYMPRMLSGHLQGRILSMLSKMIQPRLIVEVGTFTGYSAICLAEGLAENGKLITLEANDEVAAIAQRYFDEGGFNQIELQNGDARELIPAINGPIDLAFIDADKENYTHYWNLLLPKMRNGGLIIADNVLWSGKVLDPIENQDAETKALLQFTQLVEADDSVDQLLLPVRDGLLIVRKK
jgi:caffeoyl-CoA O-methyltransferase